MGSGDSAAARQRRSLVIVGVVLLVLATVTWVDALRLGTTSGVGIGPSVSMKLIGSFIGLLGMAHLIAAFRRMPATTPVEHEDAVNHQALGWVLGGLLTMIGILAVDGGFILAATVVFAATARAFGRPVMSLAPVYGLVLSTLVYAFFTKVLTLTLPSGPIERLLFA